MAIFIFILFILFFALVGYGFLVMVALLLAAGLSALITKYFADEMKGYPWLIGLAWFIGFVMFSVVFVRGVHLLVP